MQMEKCCRVELSTHIGGSTHCEVQLYSKDREVIVGERPSQMYDKDLHGSQAGGHTFTKEDTLWWCSSRERTYSRTTDTVW